MPPRPSALAGACPGIQRRLPFENGNPVSLDAQNDSSTALGRQVDLGRSVETGQLELATPADAYLRTGRFSTDDMLAYWHDAVST